MLLASPSQTLSHVRHCLWLPWPPLHVLKTWQRPFLGLHCANLQFTFIIHLLPVEGAKERSLTLFRDKERFEQDNYAAVLDASPRNRHCFGALFLLPFFRSEPLGGPRSGFQKPPAFKILPRLYIKKTPNNALPSPPLKPPNCVSHSNG